MTLIREMIREFSTAFGRPVNEEVVLLSPEHRLLLGNLIFEECVEYLTKGLGLKLVVNGMHIRDLTTLVVELDADRKYDPIESADGLGDMNVVIHFNANWHGFNLDEVTAEIHRSNMSKLGADGKPIINGLTPGYRRSDQDADGVFWCDIRDPDEPGYDPSKPMGKILKGPHFFKPNIAGVIYSDWYGHITPIEPRESALEERCPDHPNATYGGGFGLAGGGFGSYNVCDECGKVFGKQVIPDEEDL